MSIISKLGQSFKHKFLLVVAAVSAIATFLPDQSVGGVTWNTRVLEPVAPDVPTGIGVEAHRVTFSHSCFDDWIRVL